MCTNIVAKTAVTGSAKSGAGWTRVDEAIVGYDHATHAWVEHSVRLDFCDTHRPDAEHVAVELDLASGRELLKRLAEVIGAAERSESPVVPLR
jgi:hypothetical protein